MIKFLGDVQFIIDKGVRGRKTSGPGERFAELTQQQFGKRREKGGSKEDHRLWEFGN